MKDQLQAIATVLSLVNPAICAAIFTQATEGEPPGRKIADATKASLATLVILTIAALVGTRLLDIFGVSLDAFMVAGGIVLAWMGFAMLDKKPELADTKTTHSLTKLILFAASPGSITGVITLSAAHKREGLPITSLVAIAVAAGVMWLVLVLVARFDRKKTDGGLLKDTLTRFMGLIVLSMGVQFALTGLRAFMSATTTP